MHAAIGKLEAASTGEGLDPAGRGGSGEFRQLYAHDGTKFESSIGILMCLNVFKQSTNAHPGGLHLLSAYESGEVMLRRYMDYSREVSIEGRGWECLWKSKGHVESGMSLCLRHAKGMKLTTFVSDGDDCQPWSLFRLNDIGRPLHCQI